MRNRSITKRRIEVYGQSPACDGCSRGTYSHTPACRDRFNRLINEAEPLDPLIVESGGGSRPAAEESKEIEGEIDLFRLFDIRENLESDADDPDAEQERDGYEPTLATSTKSSNESGIFDEELGEFMPVPGGVAIHKRKQPGTIIEFCCEENSAMCRVCDLLGISYIGVTKASLNIDDPDLFEQLLLWIQHEIQDANGTIHLWCSLPCTVWSPWQNMAIHKYGQRYKEKLLERRLHSLGMVSKFREVARLVKLSRGGSSNFEWSRDSVGWSEPEVQDCMSELELELVMFEGCAFNLEIDGKFPEKRWTVATDNPAIKAEFAKRRCHHPPKYHDHLEGKVTTKSGVYNISMAACIVSCLFPGVALDHVPAMPVVPFHQHEHREKDVHVSSPSPHSLAAIHKLLTRKEMLGSQDALQAIAEEAQSMRDRQVWDDSSVMEVKDRIAWAKAHKKDIHLAELMTICSIKHWEIPHRRKHKSRIVFRGDAVRTQTGASAEFGQLYSTPSNLQCINIALFYGLMANNKLLTADCRRAYLQALLLSDSDTYVIIPPELWKKEWHGHFHRPCVKLEKALYGHPRAAAYWDLHLKQVLQGDLALELVEGFPSLYFQASTGLLVVVYVDDILVAGPEKHQAQFWDALKAKIELDEVEDLTQFLGRYHHVDKTSCVLDMVDYCKEAVSLYLEVAGNNTVLKQVPTPYVNSGLLVDKDYETQGEVSHKASSVLMKLLWVCRLARPDLAFGISSLATQVTRWSRNADKQLYRLVSYLHSTCQLCLKMVVVDPPSSCTVDLFVDADLGGCPFSAKSTSGLFLVVRGPNGTFCPLTWSSRRQQHVARSTADAELNALSGGVFEELSPTMMLMQLLFKESAPAAIIREDNAAVIHAINKGYSIKLRHLARTPKTVISMSS